MSTVRPDETEYRALRHGAGALRLERGVVVAVGPDAASFLQGQLSQDVAGLATGASAPALVLEPDGKLNALVRVTRTDEDRFVVDTDAGFADALVARLSRFRLRTKVDLVADRWPCVALRGEQVPDAATLGRAGGGEETLVVPVDWNGTRGVDLLGPGADSAVPGGVTWCAPCAFEALRIEAGIPAMGAELDERTIAAEAHLVERTVSFTKGCYTGQELVARLDARGTKVARRLCGIVPGDGVEPEDLAGAVLWVPGNERAIGQVTSAAYCPGLGVVAGLGYVHRSVETGDDVVFGPGPGASSPAGGTARVAALPLVG